MTVREVFPESPLTPEQWQHVQALSRIVGSDQARWLSGYFAGMDAALARLGQGDAALPGGTPPAGANARTLTILYGTETGNSTELAKALGVSAAAQGLSAEIVDMANYKPRRLKDEQDVLIVVSTYGEGDPPQPAVGFFEFIEGHKAPRLEGVRFTVLALGDSTYEFYCEAGKRLDRRFEELGAERLHPRVDCDIDYDEPAAAWSTGVIALLAAEAAENPAQPGPFAVVAGPVTKAAYDKRNPFDAKIIDNIVIVGRGSSKETRHIELDLADSGLTYEPGDAIGIATRNDPASVAALLEATGLEADAPVKVKGESTSLGEALEQNFEIMIASPRFIDQWATLTGAAELERLRHADQAKERHAFLEGHHVVDIVRKFPLSGIDAEGLTAGLRPLQPRLYSIASSLAAAPDEVHITLAPVRYDLHGERRNGVASAHLCDRAELGSTLPVYVQANPHFRLPKGDAPIIMVGAGTGVAPYRSFLQQREADGNEGRSWLFFGERNFRSDFLYQTEWQAWLKDKVLTRMDVAFSRDRADKTYVQHRMLEQAADLYAWLEEGAHLYVCGDATYMAPDVHETLITIVEGQSGGGREAAEDYVRKLQADHRYQRDVY